MSNDLSNLPALVSAFRTRWKNRDARMTVIDAVVRGDFSGVGPDDEDIENRSPNLVQVAMEDTAEAASLIPTIRVRPSTGSIVNKKRASAMERIAASYLDVSQYELLHLQGLLHLVGFGFAVFVCNIDPETGSPRISVRDPRTVYPETGWNTMDSVRECIITRNVYVHQLPAAHQALVERSMAITGVAESVKNIAVLNRKVSLIEWYCEEYTTIAAIYMSVENVTPTGTSSQYTPVKLDRVENPGGICPVVIPQRISLDNEPRGQMDQIVRVMQAHIRLMGMVLDYADQAVYSDVWVKDLIGEMSWGGNAYIQLGPQGAIGRVPPAVTSLSVQQELQQLVDSIHLGGRWPKSRPGEIDQAIASAKFIEATAGMMNTVIRTLHLIMKRAMEQLLRIAFKQDLAAGRDRTIGGVSKNQQFLDVWDRNDIDLAARIHVDYGIGLGRDPAQSMVLGIQGMQTGLFSKEFVQENFEGLNDVALERARIDVEQLRDLAFAQLVSGLQDKSIPPGALVDIADARMNGDDIFQLFKKFVSDPQKAQTQSMVPTGLSGPQSAGPPPAAGPPPPQAPPAEAILAGLPGGGPGGPPPGPGGAPPPGGGTQSVGRLSLPIPGRGGFASTQSSVG